MNEAQNTKNVLVACYGSLRRGMSNYRTNDRAGAEWVATGYTETPYRLCEYGGGGFPAISLTQKCEADRLVVDIFRCTQEGLEGAYDRLEGYYPNQPERSFYIRTLVPVIYTDENNVEVKAEAWIYHIDDYEGKVVVPHGDWVLHKTSQMHD